jgi:hypothetical protein
MFLQLTPTNAFWSLLEPNTRAIIVHLTFQNPGPVYVDYDALDPHLQKIIDNGILLRNIIEVKSEPEVPEEVVEEVDPPDNKRGMVDQKVQVQMLNIAQLLELGVRGVRDQLRTNLYDVEYITRAIETEKEGKARQTVTKALEQKLGKLGGAGAVLESEEEEIEILVT